MDRHYIELKVTKLLSRGLGYIKAEDMKTLQTDIGQVERLNALISFLEKKHLNPRILESWNPGTLIKVIPT